jgi:hypothetical protein
MKGLQLRDLIEIDDDPNRLLGTGGEHIHDLTAEGVLSPHADPRNAVVSKVVELGTEVHRIHLLPGVHHETSVLEVPRGRNRSQQGPQRGNEDLLLSVEHLGQNACPRTEDAGVARCLSVWHRLPPRKEVRINPKKVQISDQILRFSLRRENNEQLIAKVTENLSDK